MGVEEGIMTAQKTYWHLSDLGRKPGEYDIVTSKLLYYRERGFEVNVPLTSWYEQNQNGSPLTCNDWDRFRDPRETTYSKYTELQKRKEIYVDGLLASIESSGHDHALSHDWIEILARVMGPLRYPVHGLQMIAAYIGSMAPSGRVVITAMLQAADEMRRVQRLAYRMRQLQHTHPGFGAASKELWQNAAMWQPLRKLIERLLVTYDWGEALVALTVVVKPVFDELFMNQLGQIAAQHRDSVFAKILQSLDEDCRWHKQWSRALVDLALADTPGNRAVIARWIHVWAPLTLAAARAFGPIFDAGNRERAASQAGDQGADESATVYAALCRFCDEQWQFAGVCVKDLDVTEKRP